MKTLCASLAALALLGCASAGTKDLAGYGGISERTDAFSGARLVETGNGHVFCAQGENLFCMTGYSMAFTWKSNLPDKIIVTVTYRDYENLTALDLNIDGQIVSIAPADGMTEFSRPSGYAASAKSYQRYLISLDAAKMLASAQKVMVRVNFLNNRTATPGEFTRPTAPGQPSARELLIALLAKVPQP